jgi:uncharacterized protein YecT (DUF1311 family)
MPYIFPLVNFSGRVRVSGVVVATTILLLLAGLYPRNAASQESASPSLSSASGNENAIFQKPIPRDQLAFLGRFGDSASGKVFRDKHFRKLMRSFVPDCMFHYGRDMPLSSALELVLQNSQAPVQVRDGRYMTISGHIGPYLGGRGFLWIDMQQGLALGGFYFHPTNGEPTPTVAVFSSQVREKTLRISQLPPAFAADLNLWSASERLPAITTRYFLTGANKRILLEHDEDYCAGDNAAMVPSGINCGQMNADAADFDEAAAYYLVQVHYATNATAWMAGADQVAWLQVRDDTCGGVADPLGCRIRVTRERTRRILER